MFVKPPTFHPSIIIARAKKKRHGRKSCGLTNLLTITCFFLLSNYNHILASLKSRATDLRIPIVKPEIFTGEGHRVYLFGGMEFVRVPAGKFVSRFVSIGDELQRREVTISYDYWIGRFPVTYIQYARFARAAGFTFEIPVKKELHPVNNISWYSAQAYISWLYRTFQNDLPQNYAFRLPSDEEWEKAARGTDGRIFPWGDESKMDKREMLKFWKKTTPVGYYSPQRDSPYGAADMLGSVPEWTRTVTAEEDMPMIELTDDLPSGREFIEVDFLDKDNYVEILATDLD